MNNSNEQKKEVPRLIYYREVRQLTGLSRSTIWKMEKAGKFPRRRLVTGTKVGWMESEVLSWIESRVEVEGGETQPKHNLPHGRASAPSAPTAPPVETRKKLHRPTWMERDDD